MTLNDIKQKLEYKLRVSKENHKKNLELSSSFFEELMEYLKSGTKGKLSPLNLEKIQEDILDYGLSIYFKGKLKNIENEGRVLQNKIPFLRREYETNGNFNDNHGHDIPNPMQKRANFNLEWDVMGRMPSYLNLGLFSNQYSIGHLYFFFLRRRSQNQGS